MAIEVTQDEANFLRAFFASEVEQVELKMTQTTTPSEYAQLQDRLREAQSLLKVISARDGR